MAPGAVVSARELTKFYGRTRGVVELTFDVEAGEVFGFLGPNGAGKTTTIRTMLDFISPTRGRIARCAPLIKEGRELLGKTQVSKADQDKAKALLDEAQKNLDAGDHANGVKNASAALDILKKN